MNVRELRSMLFELDQELIVVIFDGGADCHVDGIVAEEFTARLVPGEHVAEEDLA